MSVPRPLRSLRKAGSQARLGNLLPSRRSGAERFGAAAAEPGQCGMSRPVPPAPHRARVGAVPRGTGVAGKKKERVQQMETHKAG